MPDHLLPSLAGVPPKAAQERAREKFAVLQVRCFDSLEEAAHLREDIDALNRRSARPDPFSTFEFFTTFVRHDEFITPGQGLRVWFLAAFEHGQLVGYLALRLEAHAVWGMPTSTLGFLVTHDTDRPHVVAEPEQLHQVSEAFYAYVLGRQREWSVLELQQQDDSSSLFPPPRSAALGRHSVRQWPSLENCSIPIRWASLDDYFQAMAKKYRTNLARQMRKLLAAGQVELLSSSDPATTPALFALYRSIEPHSWKAQANASIGRHPKRVDYFKDLLGAEQPMQVTIHVLLLDGAPIAGLISGVFDKSLYALHIVYDDRAGPLAPGSAMLLMGMRQAIASGCTVFNLLSGFGYYKTRWLAEVTPTRIAQIYRLGSLAYWHRVLGDWGRRLRALKADGVRVHHNPQRREVAEREAAPPSETSAPGQSLLLAHTHAQRVHALALVAEIRSGAGEFLSGTELAAAMPVEVRRAPVLKPTR